MVFLLMKIILLTFSSVLSIKVISTDPDKPLERGGFAEIQNTASSVSGLDRFTLCLRLITFQVDPTYGHIQVAVNVGGISILSTFSGTCGGSDGCETYYLKLLGDEYGKPHGATMNMQNMDYFLFPLWPLNAWQGLCLLFDKTKQKIKIMGRGLKLFETYEYVNISVKNDSNIILMNGCLEEWKEEWGEIEKTCPMHGAISDVNIWDRLLSDKEVTDWTNCNQMHNGNVVAWDTVSLKTSSLNQIDFDEEKLCPEALKRELVSFKTPVFSYKKVKKFCKKVGAEVAVAYNDDDAKIFRDLNYGCSINNESVEYFLLGHIWRNGHWVNINNGEQVYWKVTSKYGNIPMDGDYLLSQKLEMSVEKGSYFFCPICEYNNTSSNVFKLR